MNDREQKEWMRKHLRDLYVTLNDRLKEHDERLNLMGGGPSVPQIDHSSCPHIEIRSLPHAEYTKKRCPDCTKVWRLEWVEEPK